MIPHGVAEFAVAFLSAFILGVAVVAVLGYVFRGRIRTYLRRRETGRGRMSR